MSLDSRRLMGSQGRCKFLSPPAREGRGLQRRDGVVERRTGSCDGGEGQAGRVSFEGGGEGGEKWEVNSPSL